MTEKGITIREAAKLAEVSTSTIDDWRSGAMPEDYLAVKKLAKGLGISFSYLLTGEHDTASGEPPSITETFADGGLIFDGFAKITIQRLLPRRKGEKSE